MSGENTAPKVCVIFISNPGQKTELKTIRKVKMERQNEGVRYWIGKKKEASISFDKYRRRCQQTYIKFMQSHYHRAAFLSSPVLYSVITKHPASLLL